MKMFRAPSANRRELRNAVAASALLFAAPQAALAQQETLAAQPNQVAVQPAQPNSAEMPVGAAPPAYIGTTAQDVGVMDRLRPEYDPKGVPLGAFRLFPNLVSSVSFDDNVRRRSPTTSDIYFEQTPTMRLQSQWGRHFFEIYGGVDNFNYVRSGNLNLTDWNIGSDGRYDISRAMTLSALGSYGLYHENLESPNVVGGQVAPVRFFKTHGEMTATYTPGALGFGAGVSVDRFNWGTTYLIGFPNFSNADRDETVVQTYGKILYNFSPGYSGFVKVLYDSRSFDRFFDRGGLHRSSNGFRINGGLNVQLSHLIAGEIFLGYLEQHYAKNVPLPLPDVSGIDFGIALDYYATPLLTLHLNAMRQISDITIYLASATDNKSIRLSADYELLRNVIVTGYASYRNSSFVGLSRMDNYPAAGIKGRYLVNSNISADLGFNYSARKSNVPFIVFDDNTVTLALNLHI